MIDAVPLSAGATLRSATVDDAPALTETLLRNRAYLAPFDVERPESFWTEAGQRKRMDSLVRQQAEGTLLSCVLERSGAVLGYASLSGITFGPVCTATLGYRNAGQCSGLQAGVKARAGRAARPEQCLDRDGSAARCTASRR